MNILNFKISSRIYAAILLSIAVAACGGKPDSYSGNSTGTTTVPPPVNANAPIVDISAASTSIPYNSSTTITWSSSRSTSCSSSPSGLTGVSGSYTTPNLTSTTTYILTCVGAGGSTIASVKVTVAPSAITAFADSFNGQHVTVTSANTLSNGEIITISGTTNYNGTYTVTNVTATSFRIVHAYNGNDATGFWQMAGGMISGCSTTGATGVISLSHVPSRFNGVAPLAVFFDTVGTTATTTTRPFHELEYRWNFGDSAGSPVRGATWSTGSKAGVSSRNIATGSVASHVYEAPGIYNVNVAVSDGTNTVTNSCAQIVVQDPDVVFAGSNTTCVSANSVPVQGSNGCPAGANTVQQSSFPAAVSSYALTGKRVLFKRGDTFSATTEARLINTGPGILGSYGTGALPLVTMTGNTDTLSFSAPNASGFSDWRIMDLAFNGGGTSASHGAGINSSSGGITQVTLLRATFSSFETSIGFGADALNWVNNQSARSHTIDQLAVVDCTTTNGNNTSYSGYNAGNRVAFMGNYFENGGLQNRYDQNSNFLGNGTHVLRFPYLNRAVISNNHILHPGGSRHAIKMHAPYWIGGIPSQTSGNWSNYSAPLNGDGYTKYVMVADNYIASAQEPWQVAISPQDSASDERLHDIILERNLHIGASNTQLAQILRGQEITSRNNIFHGGSSTTQSFVQVSRDGGEPPASNIRIFNNTYYTSFAVPNGQFVMVDIPTNVVSNITISNNLAYAPNASNPLFYTNAGAANVVVTNNSSNSQVKNSSPLFTATPPSLVTDWTPLGGSYAINSGTTVPVWSDFFLNVKPLGAMDIGAVEVP